jgi:hypothetical protein
VIELRVELITGMMLGLELPGSFHEDMEWSLVIDLLIFRFILAKWKSED